VNTLRTVNLLIGFGIIVYSGLLALAFVFNGDLVGVVSDIAVGTIGTILGFVIGRKTNKQP